MAEQQMTTVKVSKGTVEDLRKLGKYGETMDDIICRAIKALESAGKGRAK